MKQIGRLCIFIAYCSHQAAPLPAGTYLGTTSCSAGGGCVQGMTQTSPPRGVNPFGIVHVFGYTGAAATYQVRICVDATPESGLEAAVQWAVDMWTLLLPRTENCYLCTTVEEGDPSPLGDEYNLATVMLHELGHCALGLDHGNRRWNADGIGDSEVTSFTLSWDDIEILAGSDGVRGSYDDTHDALFGEEAESVFWFKNETTAHPNDPITVDNTVIDISTFGRSVQTGLPPDHSWSANASRKVGESLGHGTTQSAMYSAVNLNQIANGLSADDVSTIEMSRTGVDRVFGTADDYAVALSIVPCVDPHELRVRFVPLTELGPVARCSSARDFSYAQNPFLARDYSLVVNAGEAQLEVEVNRDFFFEPGLPIFADGFDSGNTTAWSGIVQ